MLRLRPSELTLTSDDVEETFRRIAYRQASAASAMAASRASGIQGRPVLRRGPQRATRDAITALGDIPILRPQPQQATFASVDEEDDSEPPNTSSGRNDSVVSIPPSAQASRPASAPSTTPLASHTLQLPFRPGPSDQASSMQRNEESAFAATSMNQGPAVSSHNSNFAAEDSSRVLSRPVTPSNSRADLRGGGRSSKKRGHANNRDAPHAPSPYHQRDPVKQLTTPNSVEPILHLDGYFKYPYEEPVGTPYHFNALYRVPSTEPRRHSNRRVPLPRSLSVGSVPSFNLGYERPDFSESSTGKMFDTIQAPEHPTRPAHGFFHDTRLQTHQNSSPDTYHTSQGYQANARSRQFSSSASSTSADFSYYGSLPSTSRHSSGALSGQDHFSQYQYDGAAASRYPSNRASSASRFLGHTGTAPTHPATSENTMYTANISPLPSSPYMRTQGTQNTSRTVVGFPRPAGSGGNYMDAATAAARDLRSPLDDYSMQYQRFMQVQHAQQPVLSQPYSYDALMQLPFPEAGLLPQPVPSQPYTHDTLMQPPFPEAGSPQQPVPFSSRTYDALMQLPFPEAGLPHAPAVADDPAPRTSQSQIRTAQLTRTSQRASENTLADAASNDGRTARSSQVQTQRAAYELLQGASQAMQSLGTRGSRVPGARPSISPIRTRDVCNQSRLRAQQRADWRATSRYQETPMTSSPVPPSDPRQTLQGQFDFHTHERSPAVPSSVPRHSIGRVYSGDGPQRTHTRAYRQGPATAAPSLHLHPTRDSPLTSLALDHGSGMTSRGSRSPVVRAPITARIYRRMPSRQRDQENSMEGEIGAMRREETAINSRYGGDEQREVMDETPPRIGRVERRMFG